MLLGCMFVDTYNSKIFAIVEVSVKSGSTVVLS